MKNYIVKELTDDSIEVNGEEYKLMFDCGNGKEDFEFYLNASTGKVSFIQYLNGEKKAVCDSFSILKAERINFVQFVEAIIKKEGMKFDRVSTNLSEITDDDQPTIMNDPRLKSIIDHSDENAFTLSLREKIMMKLDKTPTVNIEKFKDHIASVSPADMHQRYEREEESEYHNKLEKYKNQFKNYFIKEISANGINKDVAAKLPLVLSKVLLLNEDKEGLLAFMNQCEEEYENNLWEISKQYTNILDPGPQGFYECNCSMAQACKEITGVKQLYDYYPELDNEGYFEVDYDATKLIEQVTFGNITSSDFKGCYEYNEYEIQKNTTEYQAYLEELSKLTTQKICDKYPNFVFSKLPKEGQSSIMNELKKQQGSQIENQESQEFELNELDFNNEIVSIPM